MSGAANENARRPAFPPRVFAAGRLGLGRPVESQFEILDPRRTCQPRH